MTARNILFLGTSEDEPYLPRLKSSIKHTGATYVATTPVTTLIELTTYCKKKAVTGILTTQVHLIPKLTKEDYGKKNPSINDWAGSYFIHDGVEIVFVHPLKQLLSISYGKFLMDRYASKLTHPENWHSATEFSWEIATEARLASLLELFENAFAIAVDIETSKDPLAITCIGYCGIFYLDGVFQTHSIVLPMKSEIMLTYMRKFNALPIRKITQKGRYDLAYTSRYRAPLSHWLWDTATIFHSWYAELPKDLGALAAFAVRDARYWKHEGKVLDWEVHYLYNAKDTWNTANVFLSLVEELPQWAVQNYLMEFPLNYPAHLCELQGLPCDVDKLRENKDKQEKLVESSLSALRKEIGVPGFNPNSPKQVMQLMKALGCGDLTSSDEASIKKASYRHALNSRILSKIISVRKARKLISTYLQEDKLFQGHILYALHPEGTDTGRLASTEHHFWTGLQIQNIPRGKEVKSAIVPPIGFLLGEADYAQAESRGTGYITGEEKLIAAVEGTKDFHSLNASAFFGVPYEKIYDDMAHETIDKDLRDLSKRTNHGANYNMGKWVMLETMGEENVAKAKQLLGLPRHWSLDRVCEHLLDAFASTYPKVKVDYQNWIKYNVPLTRMLTGSTGWTRYCFGNPQLSKPDLNAYVAHCPQSLNAMILNKAFMKVFYEVWRPNKENFHLHAQIHDSILFSYRKGYEHLADEVKRCMEFPVQVTDITGKVRTMLVPVDLKIGLTSWAKG